MLPRFEPMLAANRPARVPPASWALEPKLDGWRVLVYLEDGRLAVRTRRGRAITDQVPELAGLADAIGRSCVLDGELVAGVGRPWDFYRVAPRLARRRGRVANARPLTFVAFDVLWRDDGPTISLPCVERRQLLEGLELAGPAWATAGSFDEPVDDVMEACASLGLEGMVAKRTDSPYRPGVRSDDWLKLKTADWRAVHAPRRVDARRQCRNQALQDGRQRSMDGDVSADDGLDRQGTFWRAMYRRGERFEDASPLPRLPRWNWLANYGKLHPIIGSALQAAVWGLLMLPFFLIFALAGLPLFVVLCFDAGAAVLFGLLVGGYNLYASRHGEPWAQR